MFEGKFETWRDYRGQVGFDVEELTSLIRFIGGRNQEVHHRMGPACGPGLESLIAPVIDIRLESSVPQPDAQLSIALPIQNGQGQAHVQVHGACMGFQVRRQVLLVDEEVGSQSADHNDFVKKVTELGCHVEACLADTAQLPAAVPVAV